MPWETGDACHAGPQPPPQPHALMISEDREGGGSKRARVDQLRPPPVMTATSNSTSTTTSTSTDNVNSHLVGMTSTGAGLGWLSPLSPNLYRSDERGMNAIETQTVEWPSHTTIETQVGEFPRIPPFHNDVR